MPRGKAKAKPTYVEKAAPAAMTNTPTAEAKDWRDPTATFAPDDESLDARMWRMAKAQEAALRK